MRLISSILRSVDSEQDVQHCLKNEDAIPVAELQDFESAPILSLSSVSTHFFTFSFSFFTRVRKVERQELEEELEKKKQ